MSNDSFGSVQTVKSFTSIRELLRLKFPPKQTHSVNTTTKTALVIAFAVVALLLLLVGIGIITGTMTSEGMLGIGSMDGISWMWLPILLVVVLGFVFFSVIFGKK